MLIQQGKKDVQVYAGIDFVQWKNLLEDRDNCHFRLYENLNHCFIKSKGNNILNPTGDYWIQDNVDEIVNVILWCQENPDKKEQIRKNNPRRKCVKCLEYDIIEISYRKMSTTLYEKYGIICSHASISAVVNGKQNCCGKDKDGNPLQLHFIQIDDTYND